MKKLIYCLIISLSFLFFGSKTVYGAEIITDGKLITVDLTKQTLFAWESGKVVFQTKISSGLPKTPTVRGSYNIRTKVPSQRMKGGSKWYGYYNYPNVPNVMYFYQGYAIHGAYWHNNFGRPNSHGCVNVRPEASAWLYNWASVGTRVEIY
jgi:lipoprotein-anchoring transpeptidase ErfK/SrfK